MGWRDVLNCANSKILVLAISAVHMFGVTGGSAGNSSMNVLGSALANGTMSNNSDLIIPDTVEMVTWPSGANDSCVEDALSNWYEVSRNSFFQYSDLTTTMFSSRLLYQTLFTLSFDPSSLGKYCELYKVMRERCDRCPNSPNKAVILNGFALGDDFCLRRLQDYMSTTPCLSKQESLGTFASCNNGSCSEYDSAPYIYTNPNDPSMYIDTISRMALDCKYLQCDIDCRQPIILKQCGRIASTIVVDSLTRVFTSIYTGLKGDAQSRILWESFPEDCRRLMRVAKIDPPPDGGTLPRSSFSVGLTFPAANSTQAPVRSTTVNSIAYTRDTSTGTKTMDATSILQRSSVRPEVTTRMLVASTVGSTRLMWTTIATTAVPPILSTKTAVTAITLADAPRPTTSGSASQSRNKYFPLFLVSIFSFFMPFGPSVVRI